MAIIQSIGFNRGMADGFTLFDAATASNTLKVYQNLTNMPTDADNWSEAGSVADELVTFTSWAIATVLGSASNDPTYGTVSFVPNTGLPNPANVAATASGTAAWYAMYNTGDPQSVILGEVSVAGGIGTLILDNLTLTVGADSTVQTWAINFIT